MLIYFSVCFQFLEHSLPDAGNILSHGKFYGLFLGGDGEVRQPFLYLSLRCLQLKITNMAKRPIVGRNVLNPFKVYMFLWEATCVNTDIVKENHCLEVFRTFHTHPGWL